MGSLPGKLRRKGWKNLTSVAADLSVGLELNQHELVSTKFAVSYRCIRHLDAFERNFVAFES